VIHRLARRHLTPRRRARVVRIVSPETRLCVSPSSKLACAANRKSPKARVVSELPRGAVEHLFESLGALPIEGVPGPSGTRRLCGESFYAPLVEVMDSVAHRLLAASEALGYFRDIFAPGTRQKHLGTAQGESIFRAQSGLEGFTLLLRERTYEDWSFHGPYCNSQPETYLEVALGSPRG
jgi:hypothetical protein